MKYIHLALNLCITSFLLFFCTTISGQKFENLALTPPMGWNSWNFFGCDISEQIIKEIADAMVSSRMKEAGYEYVVIDDCWAVDRDANGNLVADPERFPSGIKHLADYVHSKGLKFGIYSCAGTLTCQKRPGSRGYEFLDAKQFASWGVDYLKYDWCNTGEQNAKASYALMGQAIREAGRPMVFSICEWGRNEPWEWAPDVGHLWRTTGDIRNCWDCAFGTSGGGVTYILDLQKGLQQYAGPGHWNDPDMLEIGNGILTENEARAHFSLWCMLAAPLMAGNDLRNMDETTQNILTHKEMIAINQDPLGKQGNLRVTYHDDQVELWRKELSDGWAYCFFNRADKPLTVELFWKDLGKLDDEHSLRNVWQQKDLPSTKLQPKVSVLIPPHDVIIYRLTKIN